MVDPRAPDFNGMRAHCSPPHHHHRQQEDLKNAYTLYPVDRQNRQSSAAQQSPISDDPSYPAGNLLRRRKGAPYLAGSDI